MKFQTKSTFNKISREIENKALPNKISNYLLIKILCVELLLLGH